MHLWAEFCKILPVENNGQILDSPLWHSEKIRRGKIVFKNWHEKGTRVVFGVKAKVNQDKVPTLYWLP